MKYSHQGHMHEAYKETIHIRAASIILRFAKFCDVVSFFSCSYDRESRTHHLHLLKLLHQKIASSYHPLYHILFMLHTL